MREPRPNHLPALIAICGLFWLTAFLASCTEFFRR